MQIYPLLFGINKFIFLFLNICCYTLEKKIKKKIIKRNNYFGASETDEKDAMKTRQVNKKDGQD